MSRELKFRAWDTVKQDWAYFELPDALIFDYANIAARCENYCQYTGLKDTNGVEIFEGDIVIGRNYKDEAGASRVVEWSNSGYHADNLPVWAINKCEVIGDIYENPELAASHPQDTTPTKTGGKTNE